MLRDDVLLAIVATIRKTADDVAQRAELPHIASLTDEQRAGYVLACLDIANAIERGSIAGGVAA